MSVYKKWKIEELDFIKNNHNILSDKEIANHLNSDPNEQQITPYMIRRQRRKLELKKSRGRPSKIKNN